LYTFITLLIFQGVPNRLEKFGSYGVGAHLKSSDCDFCCIISASITIDQFFNTVNSYLANIPDITFKIIRNAKVPIVKLKLMGFEFDLNVARMPLDPNDFNSRRNLAGIQFVADLKIRMAKYLNCKTVCRLIKVLTKCKPFLFFSAY
jgi:poly(A) polymerase Pap1